MKIEVSAGGVIVNSGKVILVFQKRTQTWSLPKGHVENGESPEEAARREIHEEAGVSKIQLIKKLGTYFRSTIGKTDVQKQITLFHGTTNQTELTPIDPQNPEAKWVDIEEVAKVLDYKEDKEFFLSIKNKL